MTWPAVQTKANFDSAADDPKSARSEFATNVDLFNQLQGHVSSYIQGLLNDADASAARTTMGVVIGTDVQALDATLTSLAAVAGVAGDILYASGTDTWVRLAKGTDGEGLVLASGVPSWGAAGATVVAKTADETVNNSTTLQDDDHLLFAMAANISYTVDVTLLLTSANAGPDFKIGWTVPTGCTMFWTKPTSSTWGDIISTPTALLTESASLVLHSTNVIHGGRLKATVRNGANAGNLQLQWAQNSADVSDSKLLKHSYMVIRSLGAT